ncbi:hypothetical protein ACFQ9X_09240 [Catenulispora yoronensis]
MYETTTARRAGYGISTNTLFARTMTYVAATAGLFAVGAYLGRNLNHGAGFIAFIAAFVALIAMRFTAEKSRRPRSSCSGRSA